MIGEQLCDEGMIDLYNGKGDEVREGGMKGVIVRAIQGNDVRTIPVESSLISQGKYTVMVGKNQVPANRLTGRVLFPNSTEHMVRISWFGSREEWIGESQVVFSKDVNATERNKKEPERLTVLLQQQATQGEELQKSADKKRSWRRRTDYILKACTDGLTLTMLKKLLLAEISHGLQGFLTMTR